MCSYDQRIVCKINKNLLLTSLVIILMIQSYRVEAQHREKKLCSSLTEYLIENDFDKDRIAYIFNEQEILIWLRKTVGIPPKPFLVETLHVQLDDRYKSGKCHKQINDYNVFNEMYTKRIPYEKNLKCDWIRPKLPYTLNVLCKRGIGQYLLQHGTRVYHHFLKYLARHSNNMNEKEIPKKDQKHWINYKIWIEQLSKFPVVGTNFMLMGEQYINAYYYLKDCDSIVHVYNAYYDFYMEKYKIIHPVDKYRYHRHSCDLFRRLNSEHKFLDKLLH
ncbi:Hypothetical protein CINCED_3A003949 [Cinara cedri]|uniref:Uncharacterized protein n=1 Tax=Cinara cedri TaxID=506608 RepID=A0A5E4NFY1_9HEMI|nr:Hypothetical protein CINCED_3A003949 [Cinara cedri]